MGTMVARGDRTRRQARPATARRRARARGERTLRKILDAARDEFGEQGFSESSIVGITSARASRSAPSIPISTARRRCSRRWSATCRRRSATMSRRRSGATDALDGERRALESFLEFARTHRDVYRIIDEAEFVDPAAYREHYETTAITHCDPADRGAGQRRDQQRLFGRGD